MAPPMKIDLSVFETWNPEMAYVLGWAFTDGCMELTPRHRVSWQLAETEPFEIFRGILKFEKKIETCNRKHGTYYRLALNGKHVTNAFGQYGMTPAKTYNLSIPSGMPDSVFYHFLRGVIDGDGCVVVRPGGKHNRAGYVRLSAEISSGCSGFLEELGSRVGEVFAVRSNTNHLGVTMKLIWDCSKAQRVLEKVYENSEGLRLERKFAKWQAFLSSGQVYR